MRELLVKPKDYLIVRRLCGKEAVLQLKDVRIDPEKVMPFWLDRWVVARSIRLCVGKDIRSLRLARTRFHTDRKLSPDVGKIVPAALSMNRLVQTQRSRSRKRIKETYKRDSLVCLIDIPPLSGSPLLKSEIDRLAHSSSPFVSSCLLNRGK